MYWLLIFHTKDDPVAWDLSQSSHFWMDHKYITSLKQGYFFIVPKKKGQCLADTRLLLVVMILCLCEGTRKGIKGLRDHKQ